MHRLAIIGIAVLCAPAAAAGAADHRPALRISVSGELTGLGLKKIAIGKFGCAVPASLTASTGRFVIGDPVKLTCLGGKLLSVVYFPEKATAQSSAPAQPGQAPSKAPAATPGPITSFVVSFGIITLGGGNAGLAGPTVSRTGPIGAIGDSSITVQDLTCSVNPVILANLVSNIGSGLVGANVTMTCLGSGQITSLASTHS